MHAKLLGVTLHGHLSIEELSNFIVFGPNGNWDQLIVTRSFFLNSHLA